MTDDNMETDETTPLVHQRKPEVDVEKDADFNILMPNANALKTAVDIMSHTLLDVTFRLEQIEVENLSLRVDAMDPASICACKAKIKCAGSINTNAVRDPEFCIKLKPFLEILKALPGTEGIQIFRKKDEDDIHIRSLGVESHRYQIHTLCDSFTPVQLNTCETAFSIDFDLAKLKGHLGVATNLKAADVFIEILQITSKNKDLDDALVLTISCEGESAKAEWSFFQHKDDQQVSFLMQDMDNVDKTLKYKEKFSVDYLRNFTKSMVRSNVTLSFTTTDPRCLIVEYSLGQENSSIIFLLASKVSD